MCDVITHTLQTEWLEDITFRSKNPSFTIILDLKPAPYMKDLI